MDFIKAEKPIYAFGETKNYVKKVKPGETIKIETYDCFENQITSNQTTMTSLDWDRINPATGPIYVEGAEPGDILVVEIDDIELKDNGVIVTGPDLGLMGHRLEEFDVKMIPIQDEKAIFNDSIHIPLNPMIGVIGVAPPDAPVNCGTPGAHGGNMDTKLITTGAKLYLPVFQEGALFGLGDMHAAMGDGEIGVSGIEIAGNVTVTLDVIKGKSIRFPFLTNEKETGIIVSFDTLDEAVKIGVEEMIDLILPHSSLTLSELTMLFSVIGQAEISQVVDPQLTARYMVPNWFLESNGIKLF